jgi:hypothetical protein
MLAKINFRMSDNDKSLLRSLLILGPLLGIVAVVNFISYKPDTTDRPTTKLVKRVVQGVMHIPAKANIRSINKEQQAFYQKNKKFATIHTELGLNLDLETLDYSYTMTPQNPKQVVATARSKKPQLKSYTGVVIADKKSPGVSKQFICETEQPSRTPPLIVGAISSGDQFQCPPGSRQSD